MSVTARKPRMSLEEFLAWDDEQPGRHEFDGLGPVAMVGNTARHSQIVGNLYIRLREGLRGSPCQVILEGVRVLTHRTVRYPDVTVTCAAVAGADRVITDPVVLFEVLSDSTAGTDLITKNDEYRQLPSVQRYVILPQDRIGATVFAREGERWVGTVMAGEGLLQLPEIGLEMRIADLYEDVDLAPEQPDRSGAD